MGRRSSSKIWRTTTTTSKMAVSDEPYPDELYPLVQPFHSEYLPVSPVHSLYIEQSGNPAGFPVLFFDQNIWIIIPLVNNMENAC